VERHIFDVQILGLYQVLLAGISPIETRLPRRTPVHLNLPLDHGLDCCAVSRVAFMNHQINDQAAGTGGQIELVAILDLSTTFDDDVGMGFGQADDLLR